MPKQVIKTDIPNNYLLGMYFVRDCTSQAEQTAASPHIAKHNPMKNYDAPLSLATPGKKGDNAE